MNMAGGDRAGQNEHAGLDLSRPCFEMERHIGGQPILAAGIPQAAGPAGIVIAGQEMPSQCFVLAQNGEELAARRLFAGLGFEDVASDENMANATIPAEFRERGHGFEAGLTQERCFLGRNAPKRLPICRSAVCRNLNAIRRRRSPRQARGLSRARSFWLSDLS